MKKEHAIILAVVGGVIIYVVARHPTLLNAFLEIIQKEDPTHPSVPLENRK